MENGIESRSMARGDNLNRYSLLKWIVNLL